MYAKDTNPAPGRYGRGKLPGRQTTAANARSETARVRIRRSPRRRCASAAGSGVIIAIVPTEVVVIARFSPMPTSYGVPAGMPECRPCAR